ncbi:MAG: S-adenosylmethionine:tRNA ribosyltransferase-isomerase [Candidatus Kapabacteria bacterium]|nr:S-adenosylmethionine:tRNA ribosyltransferase-isomerase [Candidatus Kapabacteria bacterium]
MHRSIPSLQLRDFTYDLPSDRIALHPLPERDASKLLVLTPDGVINHRIFRELPEVLPWGSTLVVNRTRVIHARLRMQKPTGGMVEIFLTRPVAPSADPAVVLASASASTWECLIGGRNVSDGMELLHAATGLQAVVRRGVGTEANVELSWSDQRPLAEILVHAGDIPLPPYIKRDTTEDDAVRYQTVFAKTEGSVAAPTASLHFTDDVLSRLEAHGVQRVEVTLHVGLGTFKPVDVDDAVDHTMHRERYGITRKAAAELADRCRTEGHFLAVVGTTAMRTMESLFCLGARILRDGVDAVPSADVAQWEAFDDSLDAASRADAMQALVQWMDARDADEIWGDTAIMIAPGCRIAMADALITNFHQPGNTLLLLVAAMVGPRWRDVYAAALDNGYRFLSYGDSSLLVRQTSA